MKKQHKLFVAPLGVALLASLSAQAKAAVVINEVYGGGGNSGATFTNDFVELYNSGITAVNISNYEVVYSSSATLTPTTTDAASTTVISPGAAFNLAPGAFYLIQERAGTGGTTALPSPNQVDTISIASTDFAVELVDAPSASANVLDKVGVGAVVVEGTGAAPTLTNTTSAQRTLDGLDTNNDNIDFKAATPTPGATNVVPEPASLGILAAGGLLALRRRRSI